MPVSKWIRLNQMKEALINRDPLTQEIQRMITGDDESDEQHRAALEQEIVRKYNVHHLFWNTAGVVRGRRPYAVVASDEHPWWARVNWGGDLWDRELVIAGPQPGMAGVPLPVGQPPLLTITVDLSRITNWDPDRIARDVKRTMALALRHRPKSFLSTDPSELRFLWNTKLETFARDLRRYDLHRTHDLSYRLIAALEARERQGQPLPAIPKRRPVGVPVKAESSVEESVKRVYAAIHRTPYRARARTRDQAPGASLEPYACSRPGHRGGQGCDDACPEWQAYAARLALEPETAGSGVERLTDAGTLPEVSTDRRGRVRPHPSAG